MGGGIFLIRPKTKDQRPSLVFGLWSYRGFMTRFKDDIKGNSQILVIGVGGAAKGVIDTIADCKLRGVEVAFIDTKAIKKLDLFVSSLPQAEITFTLTGLGGKTGTETTPYLIDLLKKRSFWVWSILTLPFFFEGKPKIINSLKGLKSIQALADAILIIPHDKMFKMADRNIRMDKAFLPAHDLCEKLISSIYRLTLSSSWINIEFSDIKRWLGEKRSTAFGVGQSSGDNRVNSAIEFAAKDSLLGKEVLSSAKGLLVSIMGGEDLKLKEVENGIDYLRNSVPKGLNISFGVATDKSWNGKAQTGIIVSGLDSVVQDISNNLNLSLASKKNTLDERRIDRQPVSKLFRVPRLFSKPQQTTINFKSSFKGRFDKSKPTIHEGEDLDIPTFLRRKKT